VMLIKPRPIILKQKVPSQLWKKVIVLNAYKKLEPYLYKPTPNNQIEVIIYKENIEVVKELIQFQSNYGLVFDTFAIEQYKLKLFQLKQKSRLTNQEQSKINNYINYLNELEEQAFIGDYYIPQITMDTTYHRLYYHPIYRIPEKVITNLLTKFGFLKPGFNFKKVDINGALLRTVYQILFKITGDGRYKELYLTNKDVYQATYQELTNNGELLDAEREKFKSWIIQFINNPSNSNNQLKRYSQTKILNDITTYIHPNLSTVRKYMTLFCIRNLKKIKRQEITGQSFFLMVNMDGGIIISAN